MMRIGLPSILTPFLSKSAKNPGGAGRKSVWGPGGRAKIKILQSTPFLILGMDIFMIEVSY